MKIAKKLSSVIIAFVVFAMLAVTTWAVGEIAVSYLGTLNDAALCVNELATTAKTVTLTVKANDKVNMDGLQMQVNVPEGWKITGIANETLKFGEANYNLENGMIVWFASDAKDVNTDLLATVQVQVPAGAKTGEYEIKSEIIDISREWGFSWEDGKTITTKLTVCDHAEGETVDHKCDGCGEAINGGACAYKPGEYIWSEDYSSCTVIGTCACGKTETATAKSTSEVTEGNCQTEAKVTYTADFAEDWAEDQTKVVKGEKDMNKHVGEQTTGYTDNKDGKTHTVTVKCACGEPLSTTTADHADAAGDGDHKCDLCKAVVSECADAENDGDHKCDECGKDGITTCGDSDPKNHICDTDAACEAYKTGEKEHKDGDNEDSLCDYCGRPIKCEKCTLAPVEAKAATCKEAGWKAYYQCTVCTICYEDENGATEIEDLDAWKAEGGAGYVGVDKDAHIGDKTTSYIDNEDGKTHTVKVAYAGCGHEISSETKEHDFSNGDCVCGAKKPANPEQPKPGLKGDVDLNGVVDFKDAVLLTRYAMDVEKLSDAALANGDVNNDGIVDFKDAVKLTRYAMDVDTLD